MATFQIILMKNQPDFEITGIKFTPSSIKQNDEVQLRLEVRNIGQKDAESVSIRAFKESSQPFEFEEKTDFIGTLKPGETGEALLRFNVDEKADPKSYKLDLEIRYIYEDQVLTKEKNINIVVREHEGGILRGNPLIVILIVVVIIGAGVYLYLKKKKRI